MIVLQQNGMQRQIKLTIFVTDLNCDVDREECESAVPVTTGLAEPLRMTGTQVCGSFGGQALSHT